MTAATLAFQTGTQDEQNNMRKTWQQLSMEFWKDAADAGPQPRPLCRPKVYEWLVTVTSMLLVATGETFEAFVQPPDVSKRDPDAATWRSITIAIDQGGDGWSACHYMKHLGVNLFTSR